MTIEAIRLAEHLETFRSFPDDLAAAAELRRLHAEVQELRTKQWQGLTDEEIDELALDENGLPNSHIEFARAIEAKLKEKNG